MKRGVMLPPIGIKRNGRGGTSFFTVGDLPFLESVPAAVLYWDKVYAPIAIRGMAPQYDEAVEGLVSLGVAESHDLKSENSFSITDIRAMISSYSSRLTELNARESEVWSVMPLVADEDASLAAQSSPFLPPSSRTTASIEVQLRNALPVPDREIPYEDLLEFKASRKDQIQRLHTELSQVASRYASSLGEEKALAAALEDVESAISDLKRVYEEKWTARVVRHFTSAFAVDGVLPAGVTYLAGVEWDKAFFVGAGLAVLKSTVSASLPKKHSENPYSYCLEAQKI